ncbi:SorB family sulfite dehydrogenase c-type cytochrome subunit [Xanthobacter autotrophicus]|uniref:SorB family sulfite dehydrogenase c-type cytochrome subunit n=1 Tax=Xanthobacter autotrophicus TaxID=280 RepID=UPI0037268EA1
MKKCLKSLAVAVAIAGTVTGPLAGLASANPLTYELPEETTVFKPGPGIEAAENNCAACHSADYITTQPPHMGRPFWEAEVHKMISAYHAPIDDTDAKAIDDYLAATY